MMMLNQNKSRIYYSNQNKVVPIYEYYTDSSGNKIPLETGETKLVYGEPVKFEGNISMSNSGEVDMQEYGLNLSDYSAILVVGKNSLPITETSLIWYENEPKKDIEGNTDEFSADYRVVKVSSSLNVDKFVLKKVVK